jgi:hypothetical protein
MVKKLLDKIADAVVPKEIAPFLGPISMAFAGPLGLPLALTLGQLGSAKMHSGKLDPYTALGTIMSARASGFQGPTVSDRLGKGIGTLFDGTQGADLFAGFRQGAFATPTTPANVNLGQDPVGTGQTTAEATTDFENKLAAQAGDPITDPNIGVMPEKSPGDPSIIRRGIGAFDAVSEAVFPGFYTGNKFSPGKALTTIGSVTTLSALTPMAEELKKQKALDKAEEGKLFTEWFNSYKRVSGRDYAQSPFPDPVLMEKYREFMMAQGGRVGYNMGGGIMDAAPGVPPGMELDYRDSGGFIPMGSREKKDDVPAVLAKNEFVLTSDAMKGLDKMMGGSGDPRAAARYMYQMMDQLEAMA